MASEARHQRQNDGVGGRTLSILHLPNPDFSRSAPLLAIFAFCFPSLTNDGSMLILGSRDTFHNISPANARGSYLVAWRPVRTGRQRSLRPSSFLLGSAADTMRYHYPTAMRRSSRKRLASRSFLELNERDQRWGLDGVWVRLCLIGWLAFANGLAVNALSSKCVASYLWVRGKD